MEKKEKQMCDVQEGELITEEERITRVPRVWQALTRADIKTWARSNFDEDNPQCSTSSVPYYDFSEIPGAYDFTNFVSHAILAGGATLHDNGESGITGSDQWYYRSTSDRSTSWAGVGYLYEFLTRAHAGSSNVGPYAEKLTLTYSNAAIGDVVQLKSGDTWLHSTVVTKRPNSKVYVTGRTADGVYNDNQLATTIYGTQRLLHLRGNYS